MNSRLPFSWALAGFFVLVIFQGCGIYSATGVSTGDAKTVSIIYFTNAATLNSPILSQTFTEKLKQKFVSETTLKLVEEEGDMQFSGRIVDYTVTPVAIQGNTSAAKSRLTISINVKFTNSTKEAQNFEQVFSNFEDFDANKTLNEVERTLIERISDKIIQDVFNKSVTDW